MIGLRIGRRGTIPHQRIVFSSIVRKLRIEPRRKPMRRTLEPLGGILPEGQQAIERMGRFARAQVTSA